MIIVSPGTYTREVDDSLYIPQLATAIFGAVGTASKGPVDEVTLITDEAALLQTFGEPSADHLAIYAAIRYLRKGRQLKFVRVAHYDLSADGSIQNAADTVSAATIEAVSSGTWGNNLSLIVATGTDAGTYKISVLESGQVVEVYDLLSASDSTSDNYVETRINGVSTKVTVTMVAGQTDFKVSTTAVTLTGGDDGEGVSAADYIGTAGTPPTVPATGLQLFANPEVIDVNIVAVPGIGIASVVAAAVTLCEGRKDAIALIDVPYGKTVQEAVAWLNGTGGGVDDPAAAINSSYAAAYYPWVQIYDGSSQANVWVPPSGHVAGVMAYTDYIQDPWGAPAGPTRGLLSDALDIEHSASQGERDYMYSNGNVLNPIINYSGRGIMVFGQRTTQRAATALDRINVRRMLLYLRKAIATATVDLVFEPNDEDTWADFRNLVTPLLSDIQARRGIDEYQVICDETTNTTAVKARNQLIGKILLVPTKTAEMIQVDFVILNNEAQFSEF